MNLVNEVLDEFNGQLRYEDILHMTYKELGYIRQARSQLNQAKAKSFNQPNIPT